MKTCKFGFIMMSFNTIDVQGETHEEKQLEDFIKGNNYIPAEKAIAQFSAEIMKKFNLQ